MKNIFKKAGFFCICAATFFIAFNLMISAVLPVPSHVDSSSKQPTKKVLHITKYAEPKHGNYQHVKAFLNLFVEFKKTIPDSSFESNVFSKKYLSFYSYRDLPVQNCCLLI